MEFWGIEVKPGETVKCEPGDDKYLHLSQASLGVVKKEKDNENIPIYVKVDDQKLVIGTLSADKCPQIIYDLVFEKEFELSHSWNKGSVFFVGYKTEIPDEGPDDFSEDFYSESEEEEEEIPTLVPANGKPMSKDELAKTKANAVKAAKPSAKTEDSGEDDDLSEEDESDDEVMMDGEDDGSDEDDDEDESSDEDEEDEPSPKKAETGKKRAAGSALKTPASNKKAKLAAPASGEKTGRHKATPHPAKQTEKTPGTNDKSKQQTPKSAGSVPCKSCTKTFKNDVALEAHTKAKHSAK